MSVCSLTPLQSPASQLDDSVLGVGTMVVTGHVPFTIQQASSGSFPCSQSGSRFQEQQESTDFRGQALFELLLVSHLPMSHWAEQVQVRPTFKGLRSRLRLLLGGAEVTLQMDRHISIGRIFGQFCNLPQREGLELSFAGKVGRDTTV